MEFPGPKPEHDWLKQLIGTWEFTSPNIETGHMNGTEVVRPLGDLWIIGEGTTEEVNGFQGFMRITLGFDPAKGKFVGNWVGSMMDFQWIYEGELDPTGTILTLEAAGPTWEEGQTGMTLYHDIIELKPDGTRLLRAEMQKADGSWVEFMRTEYKRIS